MEYSQTSPPAPNFFSEIMAVEWPYIVCPSEIKRVKWCSVPGCNIQWQTSNNIQLMKPFAAQVLEAAISPVSVTCFAIMRTNYRMRYSKRAYLLGLLVVLSQGKLDWFECWKMNRHFLLCSLAWSVACSKFYTLDWWISNSGMGASNIVIIIREFFSHENSRVPT